MPNSVSSHKPKAHCLYDPVCLADGIFFAKIEQILGFKPTNILFYQKAFTHRSSNRVDNQGNPINYERLEFLGDAMLGSVIAAHLYNQVPTGDEGYLTKMRSKIVSREHLNELGRDLNLIDFVENVIGYYAENVKEGWLTSPDFESGKMTKDLAVCIHGNKVNHGEHYLYTEEFLDAIDENLKKKMGL